MPEGEYSLGGQQVFLQGNRAVLADGRLAGAVTTLYDNFKKAVSEMQIPLEDAVMACTQTPARSLHIEEQCGVLAIGRKADIVLLDEDLNIKHVIVDGKIKKSNE
jgi:N-acetylglucosamine-6-phosphate deacetylase